MKIESILQKNGYNHQKQQQQQQNAAFAIMKCVNLIIGAKASCIESNEQKHKIQQTKSEY